MKWCWCEFKLPVTGFRLLVSGNWQLESFAITFLNLLSLLFNETIHATSAGH